MSAITITTLDFSYTSYFHPVFKNVTATIDTDWKLGLIGRNGRGKTTLLKLIHGSLVPDKGRIDKTVHTEIFPYDYHCAYKNTLDVIKENIGGFKTLEVQMTDLLSKTDEASALAYAHLHETYDALGGYQVETDILKEMALMGLEASLLDRDFETLSGGEQTKLLILALFLKPNHFILMDEPTNHLDIDGKKILATYLSKKKGFIVITHDRAFLDTTVDHIIAINKANIAIEKGTYSSWQRNKSMHEAFEQRTKANLEKKVDQLETTAEYKRKWSGTIEGSKNPYKTHNRGTGARSAKLMKGAKMLEKRIEKNLNAQRKLLMNYESVEAIEIDQMDSEVEKMLTLDGIRFGYGGKTLFRNFHMGINKGDAIWIRGQNGSGKTSLLKIITGEITSFEGTRIFSEGISITESRQLPIWQSGFLKDHLMMTDLNQDRFMDLVQRFDLSETLFERPIETFSSGEQKKVDLARALSMDNHLLVLDEPLNYMDIQFREQLEKAIKDYTPTIVFVEHDAWFGESVANKVIDL